MMDKETKRCPYCGEEILATAKKCKHCKEWLIDRQDKVSTEPDNDGRDIKEANHTEPQYAAPKENAIKNWMISIPFILAIVIGGYFVISNHQDKTDKDRYIAIKDIKQEKDKYGNIFQKKDEQNSMLSNYRQAGDNYEKELDDITEADSNYIDPVELVEKGDQCVNISPEDAFNCYLLAAEAGDPVGLRKMGNMYKNGIGCIQSNSEAAKWYYKSALKGDKFAQYNLGFCYWDGDGVEKNRIEAVKWFRRSAEQGNQDAQEFLRRNNLQ